jgi:ketopantoate hydroxymethyltransferase
MYNKFSKSNVSKLGAEVIRGVGLTPTMEMGVMTAIPIYQMLGITGQQYQLDYEFKAFQKNEEAINELVKEAFDASLGFIKDETKEETK